MKFEYTDSVGSYAVLSERQDGWIITALQVPRVHRGNGYGTMLLNRILIDADREGVTLFLVPMPITGGALTVEELRSWYGRWGFRKSYGRLWKRKPLRRIT